MMITRQKRVPWLWVVITMLPWAFIVFVGCAFGTITTFELRKFTDDPFTIAIVLQIPAIVGVTLVPIMLYLSDHLWTRWGRRKPLLMIGILPSMLTAVLIPYAPSFVTLCFLLISHSVAGAISCTFEPLTQEIVPPHQRGRASIVHTLAIQFAVLAFFALMLGRFDDVYSGWPWSLVGGMTGEQLSFWIMALMSLSIFLLAILGIKELPPPQQQTLRQAMGGRVTLWKFMRKFFVDVFEIKFLPIYALVFASSLYHLGLGGLTALMYTDQFGYTKQEMGDNVAIGMLVMIPITLATGFIADKYNKLRVYQACIIGAVLSNIIYYGFVVYVLPDHRPSLFQMFLFGEIGAVIGQLSGTVAYPLIYDYVPRDRMGTASAGLALLRNVIGVSLGSVMGLWISFYSGAFMPHAGIRAMVVLSHPMSDQQLVVSLDKAVAGRPEIAAVAADRLYRTAWFPPGRFGEASNAWLLRSTDPAADRASRDRDAMKKQRSDLQRDLELARKQAQDLRPGNDPLRVAQVQRQMTQYEQQIAPLTARINEDAALLTDHEAAFRAALAQALAPDLVPAGSEVQDCRWASDRTLQLSVATVAAAEAWQVRDMARELKARPYVAEVRAVAPGTGGGIVCDSATWDGSGPDDAAPHGAAGPGLILTVTFKSLPPLPEGFDASSAVGKRLAAGWMAPANAPAAPGSSSSAAHLGAAAALYQAVQKIGAGDRFPIAEPVAQCAYAAQVNDYFSGYLLTIVGGIAAFGITLVVSRLEKKGVIRRAGVEEENATPAAPTPSVATAEDAALSEPLAVNSTGAEVRP